MRALLETASHCCEVVVLKLRTVYRRACNERAAVVEDPSFRALSGLLKFTARRHKFNKDSLFLWSVGLDSACSVEVPRERGRRLREEANVRWEGYRGGLVFEAHRLFVSLNLRLKDLLGPATRVKKKKKKGRSSSASG